MSEERCLIRSSEDVFRAIALFCEYHDLVHRYAKPGMSSLDRGAFRSPKDILPDGVLDLLGPKRRSDSYAYGPEAGDFTLRERIAEVENMRHGTSYTVDNVAMMPGAWAALVFALEEILNLDRGKIDKSKVVVIGPTLYQMFHYLIRSLGINLMAYDFVADLEHFPRSMDDLESILRMKPKAIVVTNPNNPDGKYFPNDILRQLIEISEHNGIYIILDELQNFFPRTDIRGLQYGSWIQSPNVIRVDSPSKRYAMAEYRVGWVIAEPELIGNRMCGIASRMSGIMGNASRAANTALVYLIDKEKEKLSTGIDIFEERWKELREKEQYVLERLMRMPRIRHIFPRDACINLTVQVDYPNTDMELAEELMREGTLLMPASGYGYNQTPATLRITFAERMEKLEHSINALEGVLGR